MALGRLYNDDVMNVLRNTPAELHKPYFDMINDRLSHGGQIGEQYRLVMHPQDYENGQENLFHAVV